MSEEQQATQPITIDEVDELMVENLMLKQQNEELRMKVKELMLKEEKVKLHDHFAEKYKINMETHRFELNKNKLHLIPVK
jgi:hypothetical protein